MRTVWLLGVFTLALFAALAWFLAPLKPSVLALQLAFSARTFGEIVHLWPPEDLLRYRQHLVADYALLAGYGAFGFLLARRARAFASLPVRARAAAPWVLPAAALCDAGENALHWWLTDVPRFGVPHLYLLAASLSLGKWLLLLAFGALAAWAFYREP